MEDIQSYLAHNCSSFLIPSITWSGKAATIICMTSTKGTKRKRESESESESERERERKRERERERETDRDRQRDDQVFSIKQFDSCNQFLVFHVYHDAPSA